VLQTATGVHLVGDCGRVRHEQRETGFWMVGCFVGSGVVERVRWDDGKRAEGGGAVSF
jgi:hypothetical protein